MTKLKLSFDPLDLHARARDERADAPDALQQAVAELDAAQQAADAALLHRDELIREARSLGVSFVALARWTGLGARRLHDIVSEER